MKEKLVRDKMPKICAETPGKTPMTSRYARRSEMPRLLLSKLQEEVAELEKAWYLEDKHAFVEELADLEEVLRAIRHQFSVDKTHVEFTRKRKFTERGGFIKGVVWDGKK